MHELRSVSSRARNHTAQGPERAVQLLVDLKDIASRKPGGEFVGHLEALRSAHASKPAFLRRLTKAGL